MSPFANLFRRAKLVPTDAEVIFDRDEPVGRPTDIVMPRRRWFRRSNQTADRQRDERSSGSRTGATS